jgi:DNA transformation protein and related proteins
VAVSAGARTFVLETFRAVPAVTLRPMMGGLCVYSAGRIFALLGAEDRIYLKAAGALAERLADLGSDQFVYEKGGKPYRMGYWTLPETALDDPDEAADWARQALDAPR